MIDAFTILGGVPTDSNERLQELLEEKELLSDDIGEAQVAYADLTNPKKRLKHEIIYYCIDDFLDFNQMIIAEEKFSTTVHAKIFVELGRWFQNDRKELFEKINNSRLVGGYTLIDNEKTFFGAIEEIRHEFVISANSYLDNLTQKESLIRIFNRIVQIPNFESFFIDELMAHYELVLGEILQEKEDACRERFSEIEAICMAFNEGEPLAPSLSSIVTKFEKALKSWDTVAQPLQKNAQAHGGQHENSEKMVHDIRNRLVELCNVSQERLQKSLESFKRTNLYAQFGVSRQGEIIARNELEKKLNDSISFVQVLIGLTQILSQVFAELEVTVEQLKEDKAQLDQLKELLIVLRNQIPGAELRASHTTSFVATPTQSKSSERNRFRILLGILSAICAILMIVGFSNGNIAMGVAFIILGLAFGIGCGAFYGIKGNKKALIAIILVPIMLILTVVVPIACTVDSGKSRELNVSNFQSYFEASATGPSSGSSIYVDYSISPKSDKKSLYLNDISSDTILLTIKVSVLRKDAIIGTHTYSTIMASKTIRVSLNKEAKYKLADTVSFDLEKKTNYLYYTVEIISCSGTIFA